MVRKSSLALLIAASLAPLSAYALGLGDLHLKSALNQELKADIDLLSVKSNELDTVKVELASTEAFDKAGLDRSFLLTQLRFRPVRRPDGSAVVEVTSRGPIPEPFLNFLVEVNWPNGRLLREYTVLLDPPATVDRRPPAVAAPAAGARSGPAAQRAGGGGAQAGRVAMPGEYGPTQANDTLWDIAAGLRPSGVSIQQMMIALQRANPDAFYRGNINYLKQGQILRVPAREDIAALSGAEARAAFLEQTARWEADRVEREGPSTAVVEAPPEEVAEAGAPASAAAQPEAPSGELRIAAAPSAGGEAGAGEGGDATSNVEELRDQLALARETNESMRQESVNLESRIQDLESQLEDMERLLSLKDDQLAQLQATLGAEPEQPPLEGEEASMAEAGGESMPGQEAMEGEEVMEGEEAQTMAPGEEAGAGDSTMPTESEGAAMEAPMGSSGPEEGLEAESGGPESALPAGDSEDSMMAGEGAGAPMTMAEEFASEPSEGMEEPAPPPMEEEPAAGAQPREAGGAPWSNPIFWAIGAVALVVLGGLGVAATRRRKETADEADESILVDNAEVSAQRSEGFATSGESDSQTDETSFLSDFSPSDIDALQDETGEVDPISEADVYMAYNRYQQAEELLRQAGRREPERTDLRFKLLEVLFAAQAADAFVSEAEGMAGAGVPQEHPTEWRKVVSMGQDLAPENPLFADEEAAFGEGEATVGEETAMVGEPGEGNELDDLDLGQLESELDAASSEASWEGQEEPRRGQSEAALGSAELGSPDPGADSQESEDWGVSDLQIESSSDFIAESEPELGEEREDESDFELGEMGDLDKRLSGESGSIEEGPYGADERSESAASADEGVGEVDLGEDVGTGESRDDLGRSASGVDLDVDRMEAIPDEDSVQIGGLDSALSELEASEDLALDEEGSEVQAEEEPPLEVPEMNEEDEVATKLDLARAYLDMGDEEGARSILDEVMSEGSEVQQSEARGLMEKLA